MEVKTSSRKYTSANNQEDLVMSTIDIIFSTTELDGIFPLASSKALVRLGSDHTPILWDSSVGPCPKSSSYKFEKWWLLRSDFSALVEKSWNAPTKSTSAIDIWQEKVRRFRKTTKGWSKNMEAELRRLKTDLMLEYDDLDIKSESRELTQDQQGRMHFIYSEINKLWLQEETKAKQSARDRNT